jgi:hypothetical protein
VELAVKHASLLLASPCDVTRGPLQHPLEQGTVGGCRQPGEQSRQVPTLPSVELVERQRQLEDADVAGRMSERYFVCEVALVSALDRSSVS